MGSAVTALGSRRGGTLCNDMLVSKSTHGLFCVNMQRGSVSTAVQPRDIVGLHVTVFSLSLRLFQDAEAYVAASSPLSTLVHDSSPTSHAQPVYKSPH